METQFILDTNAYRRLVENKYLCEIMATANEMRVREKKMNSRSLMSVLVSMELLKHFDETDPHFKTCYKALALQFFHTQVKQYGEPNNKIDFIPPINPILANHFFNNNSEYLKLYFRVIEIAQDATKDLEVIDFKKDKEDIKLITAQLLHERTEISKNFEDFLKSINGGVLDWEFLKKDKNIKPRLLQDIRSGQMLDLMAEGQIVRAHAIMDLQYPQSNLEVKRKEFRQYYEPLLKLNQLLFEKILHGVTKMADPKNPIWNTLHDSYLLAAACFVAYRERGKDIRVVLVTDDKAFQEACKGTYMEGQVWTLKRYLSFIY